jgi:hypothetical protein
MIDRLFVVPCSQRKARALIEGSLPAREAYAGQAFLMLRRWVESERAPWCILSGWYGFLWPDTRIEHYDFKITTPGADDSWEAFAALKQKQYGRLRAAKRVTVLGSRLYADNAAWLLDRKIEAPFAGLTIGRMLQAISRLSERGLA